MRAGCAVVGEVSQRGSATHSAGLGHRVAAPEYVAELSRRCRRLSTLSSTAVHLHHSSLSDEPLPHRTFASMLGGRRSLSIMSSQSQHPAAPSPLPPFTITAREGKARCATLTTPAGGKHCSHGS